MEAEKQTRPVSDVDPSLTVGEGHALGHAVKRAILDAGLEVTDALIHVEPMSGEAAPVRS